MASPTGTLANLYDALRGGSLLAKIDGARVPAHVAVIMDGNGRWAANRGLPRLDGHRAGAEAIKPVVQGATQAGVKYLTLYSFSSENWERPTDEVAGLMSLFTEMLEREIDELDRQQVRVRVLGRIGELPAKTRDAFTAGEERTRRNEKLQLILALNYGGRLEIADATRRLAKEAAEGRREVDSIDVEAVAASLYAPDIPDPDLLIRSGGDMRVSNFLLWQIAYAEMWVTKKLWPDFSRADFFRALLDFQGRQRRFGRVESEG